MSAPARAQPGSTMLTSDDEDYARALLDLSIALIDAALDILQVHIQSDEQLRKASVLMPGGTVGKHFRHVIEMFQALLDALADSSTEETAILEIDYDAPSPSSRKAISRSLPACREAMTEVRDGLTHWRRSGSGVDTSAGPKDRAGLAREMRRSVRLTAVTPTRQVMDSSVGRELWFCSLHAIHHFSMLRTIAVHELGLSLPVEFGTAPSTLLYRAQDWKPPAEKKAVRPSPAPAKSKL